MMAGIAMTTLPPAAESAAAGCRRWGSFTLNQGDASTADV
jgi:hypothetical protein